MKRLLVLVAVFLLGVPPAAAQIVEPRPEPPPCFDFCPIIRPDTRVVIESYDVDVTVDRQVATTHIAQELRNDGDWLAEGVYLLPLPKDAAVTDLELWIDNEPVGGVILDPAEARAIYEDVVRRLIDPALLEWVDHGLVQLSVFPIEPGDTRRVEIRYDQALAADGGLVTYEHPFGAEHRRGLPIEQVSISVDARSSAPIQAIYSPTHAVDIERTSDTAFRATYEDNDVAADGFSLIYSTGSDAIGLELITTRDPADDEAGYFLAFLTPPAFAVPGDIAAKDVILVLDRSGSMEGEKYTQARAAARFVLERLNPEDRFAVISFSDSLREYRPELAPAADAPAAADWLDGSNAAGSTDIDAALQAAFAIADAERPTYLIFLTDGLPTEGETDPAAILANAAATAPRNVSLFAFGVGFDVDAFLLDSLAAGHHGTADYVTPGEDIDEVVSAFYDKVTSPVLTGIDLDFGGVAAFDMHPEALPDLFAGEQLVLAGRYTGPGSATVTLTGSIDGETRTFNYDGQEFTADGGPDFVARLWATRKIGSLLRQMRLEGVNDETIDQIVRIATRFGIVTPYTSFLVEEPIDDLDVTNRLREELSGTLGQSSGEDAIGFSDDAADLAAAEAPLPDAPGTTVVGADGEVLAIRPSVTTAGSRTFRLLDGTWVDTGYQEGMPTVDVPFLSDRYFDLAAADAGLAAALALGERVVVITDGTAVRVVAADQPGTATDVPLTTTTTVPDDGAPQPAPTSPPGDATAGGEAEGGSGAGVALVIAVGAAAGLASVLFMRRRRR